MSKSVSPLNSGCRGVALHGWSKGFKSVNLIAAIEIVSFLPYLTYY